MNAYEVIIRPVITEKATVMKDEGRTLCFEVDARATKPEIRRAVETIFNVKVAAIRVVNVRGKRKRLGRFRGYTSSWKKAYVKLAPDQPMVEYFEGV